MLIVAMKLVNILEHKHLVMWIFFFMHTRTENDVHRLYTSFSRQRPFFILEENMFLYLWSPASVNPYIEGDFIA